MSIKEEAEAKAREITRLTAQVAKLEAELNEAVNWNDIVDRHGCDQFDDIAEKWLALEPVKRVHNAVTSVFSKWANDELMERFKQHMENSLQMAFVEGCLCGVRTVEAKATTPPSATPSAGGVRDAAYVALIEIRDGYCPSQPMDDAGTEFSWALRWIGKLRGIAAQAVPFEWEKENGNN